VVRTPPHILLPQHIRCGEAAGGVVVFPDAEIAEEAFVVALFADVCFAGFACHKWYLLAKRFIKLFFKIKFQKL
jgi:hypothetical protein